MSESVIDFQQHKSLNIIQAKNSQLYTTHLKHNNYISPFIASIKEKPENEEHVLSHLSLKKTNLQFASTYPISEPFHWTIAKDQCMELPKQKAEFNKKLTMYRHYYKKDRKALKCLNFKHKKDELANLPHYLVDLVIYGDNSPYFNGIYDWFYTKGSLTQVEVNNQPLLVSAQGHNIICMSLDNEETQQLDILLPTPSPLYSLQGSIINNKQYLTLRSKHQIQLELLQHKPRSTKIYNKTIYKCNKPATSAPFIDTVFVDEHKFITADVAYEVTIHDIKANALSHKRSFEKKSSNKGDLCQLEALSNCLLFMSTCSLTVLDFRVASECKERQKTLTNGFFTCNDLCTLCMSSINDNFVYVASKHNIYKCDLREMEVVKQWAHLLDNSPIVIKTLANGSEEYVFVSSFTETICIEISSDNHLPFKIKPISDSYMQLQLQHEFKLREDLEERFKLSLIGLAVTDSHLYTSNSIGDVFKYHILGNNDDQQALNEEATRKLQLFVNEVPLKARPLKPTHLKEMTVMKHVICKRGNDTDSDLKIYSEPNKNLRKFLNPAKKFGHYDMAKIWAGVRPEIDNSIDHDEQPMDRIGTWLAHSTAINFEDNIAEDVVMDMT